MELFEELNEKNRKILNENFNKKPIIQDQFYCKIIYRLLINLLLHQKLFLRNFYVYFFFIQQKILVFQVNFLFYLFIIIFFLFTNLKYFVLIFLLKNVFSFLFFSKK